jgi:hypothetical protein
MTPSPLFASKMAEPAAGYKLRMAGEAPKRPGMPLSGRKPDHLRSWVTQRLGNGTSRRASAQRFVAVGGPRRSLAGYMRQALLTSWVGSDPL